VNTFESEQSGATRRLLRVQRRFLQEVLIKTCTKWQCSTLLLLSINSSHLLDPRRRGEGLSDRALSAAVDFISNLAKTLGLNVGAVVANLAEYRTKTGFYSLHTLWSSLQYLVDPVAWWNGLCTSQSLRPIAARLLQLPPTSAACERNWSTFNHIHSKKRNRTTNERVEKLVAVTANLKLSDCATAVVEEAVNDEVVLSTTESETEDEDDLPLSSFLP